MLLIFNNQYHVGIQAINIVTAPKRTTVVTNPNQENGEKGRVVIHRLPFGPFESNQELQVNGSIECQPHPLMSVVECILKFPDGQNCANSDKNHRHHLQINRRHD